MDSQQPARSNAGGRQLSSVPQPLEGKKGPWTLNSMTAEGSFKSEREIKAFQAD